MRQRVTQLLAGILLLALAGCTAQRYLEAGDTAAQSGDMRAAAYNYQRALQHQESLARDRGFMARLATAESRVAYDDAVRLREAGDYEQAIDQLRLSIERDGTYDEPKRLLPHVRAEAARVRYVRAIEAADNGDLRQARLHLDRALQHDLSNEQAAFAKAALSPERMPDDTPGLATYRVAVALAADRNWTEAESAFGKAVGEGPGLLLARAGLHDARAQLATSRRLTAQGAGELERRAIGPAMSTLARAIEVWPFNAEAKTQLDEAKRQRSLADDKLTAAAEAMAKKQWEDAITIAENGLSIDRSHAGLRELLGELHQRAAAEYDREAEALAAAGRLTEAQTAYTRAVELDPSLRSAASGLRRVEAGLDESHRLQQAGQAHLSKRQMTGAIELLERSLEVWPFNKRSTEQLAYAKKQQTLAGEIYRAATTSADKQNWDQAIADTDEGLAIDGSHAGLVALRPELPGRAAADYATQGDEHLNAGRLDPAQAAYLKALGYVGTYDRALAGMASAHLAKGEALEATGQLGAALLHYAAGQSFKAKHPVSEALDNALAAVRERVGMGMGVTSDGGRGLAIAPDQVGDAVAGVLGRYRGDGLKLGGQGSPYELRLTVREATIRQRLIGSVDRHHSYTTSELRHNAEYDRVLGRLKHEESLLHRCRSDYDDHVRDRDAAQRHADRLRPPAPPTKPVSQPPKPGEIEKKRQRREEANRAEQARYQRELAEYQRKQRAYDQACAKVRQIQSRCDRAHSALRSQERAVKSWRHKLSNTPRQVRVTVRHTWPYTVETYSKRGQLAVRAELVDTATGKVVDTLDPGADFSAEDDLVLNANPGVGLRADRLDLPSDQTVRGSLSARVAKSTGPWAVEAAVAHRLGAIKAQADALRKAGKDDAALEADVDAAVLLGVVDGEAAWKRIDALTEEHAR